MDPFKLPWWSSDGRLLPSIRKDIHAYLLFPVHLFRRMLKEPIPPELDLRIMPQWLQTHLPAHHLLVAQVPGLCFFSAPVPTSQTTPVYLYICSPLTSLPRLCSSQLFLMHPYASAASTAFLCSWLQCSVTEEEFPRLSWAGALGLETESSKKLPTPPDI